MQLSDILAENLDVLFCGINPALNADKAVHRFSSASNRFWRVPHSAGFTPHLIKPEFDHTILQYGCGLTVAWVLANRSRLNRAFTLHALADHCRELKITNDQIVHGCRWQLPGHPVATNLSALFIRSFTWMSGRARPNPPSRDARQLNSGFLVIDNGRLRSKKALVRG
jgi:hypothetical protein